MMSMKKQKYAEIGRKIRDIQPETTGPSYEWEELVQKLCTSDNPALSAIGARELEILHQKCPKCPGFNNSCTK